MGHTDKYKKGDWYVICDLCGIRYFKSETRLDWRGLLLCDECWAPKHPQLDIRGIPDNQAVYPARPEGTDTYISDDDPVTAEDL